MPARRSEYKGNAIIELFREGGDKYPFRFGAGKAMLILENFEDICDFVKEEEVKRIEKETAAKEKAAL